MVRSTELVSGGKCLMTAMHVRFLSWNSPATAASQRTCRSTVQSGRRAKPLPVDVGRRRVALIVVRAVMSRSPSVTTTSGRKSVRSTVARQVSVVGTSCRSRSWSPLDVTRTSPSLTWYNHSTRRGATVYQRHYTALYRTVEQIIWTFHGLVFRHSCLDWRADVACCRVTYRALVLDRLSAKVGSSHYHVCKYCNGRQIHLKWNIYW